MFSIQNKPKTKYFYHSFLGAYRPIKPLDPTEYVWFLPRITVIFALFLCTFLPNLCDFFMRIEVQGDKFLYAVMHMIHTNAFIKLSLKKID